ncbi:uncharacterized protein LOC124697097 [Lolium rigidum]|uniref:uncharacterized protein LOC124697097 n=1 Tax=Lolium rigidum TaxID=89674 RepID=UPI001F5D489A|nr:uncharacterized protein LOC124697097 [Lolium rigidum]
MAASDTEEGGAPAAGGAGQDADAPEPRPELAAAGERTASDDAPAAPGASSSSDEGGAGEDDASDSPRGPGAAGEQPASDHAPVALAAAAEDEEGAVEAEQDDAPESEDEEEEVQEEDGDATEEDEDGEDDEDAPTHLPFAPTGEELPDDATTVDPSYTISLIRKLIPKGSDLEKEFSDKSSSSDDGESTLPEYEDQWEECGCILWDLAASEPQAEHMIDNSVLEVLLENLRVADSSRVKEVCLGIMGNLACHESLVNAICLEKGLITTVVNQLFLDDVKCLSEAFRLLAAALRCSASVSWAEVLLPDEILSRMLWIIGNTSDLILLEKSIDFISTVIDAQDVIAALIDPMLKVGLVDHVVGLLTTEIEKSPEEKLDRPGSLDMILRFMEELSAIHSVSEVMSSSDRLMKVLVSMIKSPDKHEFAKYCASVVIIISNILTDGKHLVPMLSHDLPFLEGLFDILPVVPDDDQARYALWGTLPRIMPRRQETEMDSSSLDQFASLFLGKFTLIKDDLESHVIDEENLSSEDALVLGWTSKCLRSISFVMEKWIEEKSSQSKQDAPPTGNSIDDAREVLSYCHKALH